MRGNGGFYAGRGPVFGMRCCDGGVQAGESKGAVA